MRRERFRGTAPIDESLPYEWHDTPNIHFLSIKDFWNFCRSKGIRVLKTTYLGYNKEVHVLPNLFALNAIFVLKKTTGPNTPTP